MKTKFPSMKLLSTYFDIKHFLAVKSTDNIRNVNIGKIIVGANPYRLIIALYWLNST